MSAWRMLHTFGIFKSSISHGPTTSLGAPDKQFLPITFRISHWAVMLCCCLLGLRHSPTSYFNPRLFPQWKLILPSTKGISLSTCIRHVAEFSWEVIQLTNTIPSVWVRLGLGIPRITNTDPLNPTKGNHLFLSRMQCLSLWARKVCHSFCSSVATKDK